MAAATKPAIRRADDLDLYITASHDERFVWRSMGDGLVLVDLAGPTWTNSRTKIRAHIAARTDCTIDVSEWLATTHVAASLRPYCGMRGTPIYDRMSGAWTLTPDPRAWGMLLYRDWSERYELFRRNPPSPPECIQNLIAFISDGQWEDDVAPYVFVADTLTCLGRQALAECSPIVVYRSPPVLGPGSGKTMAARTAAAIGCGAWSYVPAAGTDVLLRDISIKMMREPSVLFDNESARRFEGGPVSDALAAACTAGGDGRLVSTRKRSDATITTPLLGAWAATTNGAPFHPDWSRRSIECRVAPRRGRPWKRPRDVAAEALATPDLTLQAMHVLETWLSDGGPQRTTVTILPSFHDWSRVIAGAVLEYTGVDIVRAAVPAMRRTGIELLREAFGLRPFGLRDARAVLPELVGLSDRAAGARVAAIVGPGRRSTGGRAVWHVPE